MTENLHGIMYGTSDGPYEVACGREATWPVCSMPAGNTDHGLCDMVGNGYQWLQDLPHPDYRGAPADGSAWETLHPGTRRMPAGKPANAS